MDFRIADTFTSSLSRLTSDEHKAVKTCACDKPKSGRIAVKLINHLGDEVMKVFRVT